MKLNLLGFFSIFIIPIISPVVCLAAPINIVDNYIGGTATHSSWLNKDIVGSPDLFDVSNMVVDRTSSGINVSIFSTYFSNVGAFGTRLGDLFISTNGWKPNGDAPYLNDDFNNGEFMEVAAVLSDHGDQISKNSTESYLGKSGTLSVYQVKKENVKLSYADPGYIFREGQEVRYEAGLNEQALVLGTWSIEDVLGSNYDRLIFSFNFPSSLTFGSELGFHWAMTCGNDTIEGSASVPEPGTLLLLSSSFIFGSRLRKKKIF